MTPAFAPRSMSSITEQRVREANVVKLLNSKGYPDPQIVAGTCRVLNEDLVEAAFTVPVESGRRVYTAWVCRSGTVQVMEGLPA